AIQMITPAIAQAEELLRIQLLRSAGVGTDVGTASVVAAKTTIMIAELLFIALGLAVAPTLLTHEPSLSISVGIGSFLMSVSSVGFLLWQRVGPFAPAIWLSRRLKVLTAFLNRHNEMLVRTEAILKR